MDGSKYSLNLISSSFLLECNFIWRVLSSWMWHRTVQQKFTADLEEDTGPVFGVNKISKQSPLPLKMGAVCSSEALVNFYMNIWRHISEDSSVHNHRCENLKSNGILLASFSNI
jgi:hypothetical protein